MDNAPGRGGAALLTMLAMLALTASAQTYPAKPIRVIVPYPPGGTSDILTRLVGAKLTESWGQQVIADNRTGAGGNIAAELTARSAPDGYTLMLTDIGNFVTTSVLFAKLPFDVQRDFTPVITVSYSPHLLAVHPSVPVKTTRELIALAKSRPGKLNYATGLGGMPHLAGLMFALPLSAASGSAAFGKALRMTGLLVVPEEIAEPRVIALRNEIERRLETWLEGVTIERLLHDDLARQRHFAAVQPRPPASRGKPDVMFMVARAKIGDAKTVAEALAWLTPQERMAVLGDRDLFHVLTRLDNPNMPDRPALRSA